MLYFSVKLAELLWASSRLRGFLLAPLFSVRWLSPGRGCRATPPPPFTRSCDARADRNASDSLRFRTSHGESTRAHTDTSQLHVNMRTNDALGRGARATDVLTAFETPGCIKCTRADFSRARKMRINTGALIWSLVFFTMVACVRGKCFGAFRAFHALCFSFFFSFLTGAMLVLGVSKLQNAPLTQSVLSELVRSVTQALINIPAACSGQYVRRLYRSNEDDEGR